MSRSAAITMEARQVDDLPDGEGWQFEPKWDGFRCLAGRRGAEVELLGRSGKSLSRYFPEMIEALARIDHPHFLIDGELVIPIGSKLSFEALQSRLHSARSRVQRLAEATPSLLIVFDLLEDPSGRDLRGEPLVVRRRALERFFATLAKGSRLRLSPGTIRRRQARAWLSRAGRGALDGVMAKRLEETYRTGERAMLKIKHLRSADCVVGGFRYSSGTRQVGSLLLGLYNEEGRLDHVGFTSALASLDRAALTRKLTRLRGGGFTGDAPGAPSRWSTERSTQWEPVKPQLVAEVQYDHVTGRRFRHGTAFLRWRPDKAPRDCSFDQLVQEARPSVMMRLLDVPTRRRSKRVA